jgi:hypothetical protein
MIENGLLDASPQQHIADTLGLSLVHTNRTLGRLIPIEVTPGFRDVF